MRNSILQITDATCFLFLLSSNVKSPNEFVAYFHFFLTYVFHRVVFFFHWVFSSSSPPLSPAPPPFQPPPPPPPPHTLESLLAASPPQLGRLLPKDQKDLKINLFTESEQKPPREGETTQRGPSHLSWGSPPGSDLPVDWEGRSTPTIQSPQMKFRFNGHLLFLIVGEMSPRIAACGLLLAHLSIALVLFCDHLDIFIHVYGIIIIPYTYFLLHKIFDLYLKQEMWQLKGDTQYAWDPCGLQYGEVEKTLAIIMLSTMMTNCQQRRRWQWLSTKEAMTMTKSSWRQDLTCSHIRAASWFESGQKYVLSVHHDRNAWVESFIWLFFLTL